MSVIDLNKSEDFIKELTIFNDGEAGIVDNVVLRIVPKKADDPDTYPPYKLVADDGKGEVNDGYFYYDNLEDKGFKNYQAGRLIMLARSVLGEDVKFPEFGTPKEALDGVMKMIAPALKSKRFRVVVTYGTTQRPQRYLQFKSFGRFMEPMDVEKSQLRLEKSDNLVRKQEEPSSDEAVKTLIQSQDARADLPPKADDDLPF